ncbi:MAG: TIGR04076 family protein [Candidatus Heimdallarchaeota archaeon]
MSKIKVEVSEIKGECDNGMEVGDHFIIQDGKISIPDGKSICIWTLNGMLPMFPFLLEKKALPKDHWVTSATTYTCPSGKVIFSYNYSDE